MSRGVKTVKQGDIVKALKAAVKAGLSVQRYEIDREGKIIVIAGDPEERKQVNEWDSV